MGSPSRAPALPGLGSRPLGHAQWVPTVRTWGLRSTASPHSGPGLQLLAQPGATDSGSIGTPRDTGPRVVPRVHGPGRINNLMNTTDHTEDPRETRTFPTGELVYKKEAAKFLGVSLKTVDRYVSDGRLQNWKNRINGRTYYDKQDLLKLLGSRLPQTREVWVYARAAGLADNNQAGTGAKARLAAQTERVLKYCAAAGVRVDRVVEEIGKAGSLAGRGGLDKIMDAVLRKQVSMVIVETPDRIARFAGAEIIERFLTWHGVELHVVSQHLVTEEMREELKSDLTDIILESRRLIGD